MERRDKSLNSIVESEHTMSKLKKKIKVNVCACAHARIIIWRCGSKYQELFNRVESRCL